MNIPAFYSAVRQNAAATANPTPPQQQRAHQAQASVSNTPTPAAENAQRAPHAKPVIELSDTTLTRRDIPRGSLVDIVA